MRKCVTRIVPAAHEMRRANGLSIAVRRTGVTRLLPRSSEHVIVFELRVHPRGEPLVYNLSER